MRSRWEAGHIRPDLSQDWLSHSPTDARNAIQPLQDFLKKAHSASDLLIRSINLELPEKGAFS